MSVETHENVLPLPPRRAPQVPKDALRLWETREIGGRQIRVREATEADLVSIHSLYLDIYEGRYSQELAVNPDLLRQSLQDPARYLWLVAEDTSLNRIVGAIFFLIDATNRLGKAAGVVVLPAYRSLGIGSSLLELGVSYLTKESASIDVLYATSRTINEAPSRMVIDAGFHQLGLFPNALQLDTFEHLNLDVYVTDKALKARRRRPYLFPPFAAIYALARKRLKLERPYLVTERATLHLSKERIPLAWIEDAALAEKLFDAYSYESRVSNSFFPFHRPNRILRSADGGTEVFIHFGGMGQQSAIVGYRTDRVNIHDLLDSVATALQRQGAAYVELLVDAYDYKLQQEAFTARYLPSAYFPAMKLHRDGLRDDYFVLSRTFQLLDFSNTYLRGENLEFLKTYLGYYHDLYIKPILGG